MSHRSISPVPAALPALAVTAGIVLAPHLVDADRAAGLLLLAALLPFFRPIRSRIRATFPAALLCAAAGIFVATTDLRDRQQTERALATAPADEFLKVEIPLDGVWSDHGSTRRMTARSFTISGSTFDAPLTIYCADPPQVSLGATHMIAEGFLRRRPGAVSLSVKSPRLIGYARRAHAPSHRLRWLNHVLTVRLARVAAAHPEYADAASLVAGLALGRTDELSENVRAVYRRLGIYHLLVFSGMQIAFVAAAISLLLRRLDVLRLTDWVLLLLAIAAPPFAGLEPSVTRSAMMIGLYALSRILHRPTTVENLFFVSAIARLLVVPEDLYDAGFALTYAATGGMVFVGRPVARWLRAHRASLLAPLAYGVSAELATIPLTLLFFHQFIAGGALATLAAAPVVALMLTLSVVALAGLGAGAEWFELPLYAVGELHRLLGITADAIESVTPVQRVAMSPPALVVIVTFVAAILLRVAVARAWVPAALVALLTFPLGVSAAAARRAAIVPFPHVEMLDVGQGEAILIRNGAGAMLLDGGSGSSTAAVAGRRILRKLVARGVTRLDAVTISHPHPDHTNGLVTILETMPVGELRLSAKHAVSDESSELIATAARRHIPIRVVKSGERLSCGGLPCTLFVPRLHFKRAATNNSSLVHRVTIGRYAVLLTGDIEKDAERLLADEWLDQLPAAVLKVPHHGSRSSSTARLLDAVCPRVALISSGRSNPFGHPAEQVVSALRERGVTIHRTDIHRDVRVWLERGKLLTRHEFDTPMGGS